ncbi:hypothetical protein NQZ68_029547, partial [Dissostichus eleginoides]
MEGLPVFVQSGALCLQQEQDKPAASISGRVDLTYRLLDLFSRPPLLPDLIPVNSPFLCIGRFQVAVLREQANCGKENRLGHRVPGFL